ncbi:MULTISPECIES: hypothetical protein [Pseudomonas fluorescens group]|uniref:Uncharacterized protein n=2 Tax=Pseudomonas fluorescens TaxID=294 RepID=C3JZ93_PSEFS|nr:MULTISPECIES: hypothetical protein [Pseudomonas fluorescens group]KJZ58043.1 hypothetical protein VC36_17265 [Pseudomonas marginalis]KJZ58466.1 hypothetical protein VC37_01405 [Pseudomonas marginalis]MBZ6459193.1 hypothetical protein [Pseudomonas fluorescens group sp.]MBZ6464423.1 hypothetical protein [Pseudomonas fluorescens group sp.]MBZ6471374.1 hypothetical protein [Pseudomonas fluorescens group sp.]
MIDNLPNTPDTAVLDAALQMVEIWNRLSADKQAVLLKRFGTQENALAALVTTQLLAPAQA